MTALKKVIYFTAGDVPTTGEKADIAKLNAAAVAPYDVAVRSGIRSLGTAGNYESADYVAGTVPASAPWNAIDVLDPDAIPNQNVSDTQVILNDGDTLDEAGGGTIAVAIVGGVATYTYTAGA